MSNIETARAALQAELDHAKTGHAFYAERIASLEQALAQIAGLGGISGGGKVAAPANKAKRGRKPNTEKLSSAGLGVDSDSASKPAKAAKGVKSGKRGRPRKAAGGNELPFTGGDYWTNLVTDAPQSASDILASAISKLGFSPDKAQRQKLQSRMVFALNALAKDKKIADSGKGRERRFFKS